MPAASDSTLLLAAQLRSSSDADLRELTRIREVRASGLRDFFDLAEALLDPASVQAALARLDRPALVALTVLAQLGAGTPDEFEALARRRGADLARVRAGLDKAIARGLAVRDGDRIAALGAVHAQLASWPASGLPSGDDLVSAPPPGALAPVRREDHDAADAIAAERAFETVGALTDLLLSLDHDPARELARGGLSLPDSRRLATAAGIDLDDVADLLRIAERSHLVEHAVGTVRTTTDAGSWIARPTAERWGRLARAWRDDLPSDIRELLVARAHARWDEGLDHYVDWLYPAGGAWMRERIETVSADAVRLGITAGHVPSTAGAALLDDEADPVSVLRTRLPAEIRQAYVQHDLSIVAPGPLAPDVAERLRRIADLESRGLASTWRISGATLTRALTGGETTAGIRAFLTELALTGIPQPLDYLLTEAEQRFGSVRVRAGSDGRARVRSADAGLLRAIEVDAALASLRLSRIDDGLVSLFDRDVVFLALSEARYPVVAEDPDGAIELPRRPRPTPAVAPATAPDLVDRLRENDSGSGPVSTQDAWLSRQLDVAIRGRLALLVTVRLTNGSTSIYELEPAGLAGGRLRARDRRADLERTLPLTSIVEVHPA